MRHIHGFSSCFQNLQDVIDGSLKIILFAAFSEWHPLPQSSVFVLSAATCCPPAVAHYYSYTAQQNSAYKNLTLRQLCSGASIPWLDTQEAWGSQRDESCLQQTLCFAAMNVYGAAAWPPCLPVVICSWQLFLKECLAITAAHSQCLSHIMLYCCRGKKYH